MIDTIIKLFFDKKKKRIEQPKTIITENRQSVATVRACNKFYSQIKVPESEKTCLSGYFKNNKGLNFIERTQRLPIAVIDA